MDEIIEAIERQLQVFSFSFEGEESFSPASSPSPTIKDPRDLWQKLSKEEITEQKLRQQCTLETLSEVSIDHHQKLFIGLAMSEKDAVYHRRIAQINKIPGAFDPSSGRFVQSSSSRMFKLNDYDGVFDLKVNYGTWADLMIITTGYDPIRIKLKLKFPESFERKIEQKGELILEGCNLNNPLFISTAFRNRYFIETNGTEIEFIGFRYQDNIRKQMDELNPGVSISMFETGQIIEIGLLTQPITYAIKD